MNIYPSNPSYYSQHSREKEQQQTNIPLMKQLTPTVSLISQPQSPKNRYINPNTDGSFLLGLHITGVIV
jgi:hypothetical protein